MRGQDKEPIIGYQANGSQKTKRLTKLTDEEKAGIMEMTSPQDIPREERFGMLKTFLVNQGVGAIEVEEKYTRFVAELRTDKYAPDNAKAKMYKVLKEVVEEHQTGSR
ncbi:hypothetical protein AK812_SmicGene47341, partial [Symbiodinium microadriaticum]